MLTPSRPAGCLLQIIAAGILYLGWYTWSIHRPVAAVLFFIIGGLLLWWGGLGARQRKT